MVAKPTKRGHSDGVKTYKFSLGEVGGGWDTGLSEGERDECKDEYRKELWDCCGCQMPEQVDASTPEEASGTWVMEFMQATGLEVFIDDRTRGDNVGTRGQQLGEEVPLFVVTLSLDRKIRKHRA